MVQHERSCRRLTRLMTGLAFVLASLATPRQAAADAVVRGVLFTSPTCPHCRVVEESVLPPLVEKHGRRLQIAVISTGTPAGLNLYRSALGRFNVARRGVPMLIVGDAVFLGSLDIPNNLPGLIDKHLAEGGVSWPDIPGLSTVLPVAVEAAPSPTPAVLSFAAPTPSVMPSSYPAASPRFFSGDSPDLAANEPSARPTSHIPDRASYSTFAASSPTQSPEAASTADAMTTENSNPSERPTDENHAPSGSRSQSSGLIYVGDKPPGVWDRIARDPIGNGLSMMTLAWMLFTALRAIIVLSRRLPETGLIGKWFPVLALLGLIVAAYLAQVEVREVDAVCGPVGDCNTVQQSEYARLFGVLPIGVAGVAGYIAILIVWLIHRMAANHWRALAGLALFGMTTFGALFSIYLTFLEPFVIGATCAWCLSSAVTMTLLFRMTWSPGQTAALMLAAQFRLAARGVSRVS